jgi:hypothetical protein
VHGAAAAPGAGQAAPSGKAAAQRPQREPTQPPAPEKVVHVHDDTAAPSKCSAQNVRLDPVAMDDVRTELVDTATKRARVGRDLGGEAMTAERQRSQPAPVRITLSKITQCGRQR